MKSPIAILAAILLLNAPLLSQTQEPPIDFSKEPALQLELVVDGKVYHLKDGEQIKLSDLPPNPTVEVRSAPYRLFNYESIAFEYPTNFSFTFEEDLGYRIWSLDGSDFIILLFVYDMPVELDELVGEMVAQFGEENCIILPFERKLGDVSCTGKKVDVSLIGQSLSYEILDIPFPDDKKRILAFQDIKDETGNASGESEQTIQHINSTFRLKK